MRLIRLAAIGLLLASIPAMAGCTDRRATVSAAEAMGLTDVKPTGYAFARCGRDDSTSTSFTAKNASGRSVRGVACGSIGLLGKATTIRIIG